MAGGGGGGGGGGGSADEAASRVSHPISRLAPIRTVLVSRLAPKLASRTDSHQSRLASRTHSHHSRLASRIQSHPSRSLARPSTLTRTTTSPAVSPVVARRPSLVYIARQVNALWYDAPAPRSAVLLQADSYGYRKDPLGFAWGGLVQDEWKLLVNVTHAGRCSPDSVRDDTRCFF